MTRPFRRANLHGRFVRALLLGLIAVLLLGQTNDSSAAGKKKRASRPRSQSPEEQIAVALRYMPEGTAVIGSVDVPAVLRSEMIQKATGSLSEIAEKSEEIRAELGVSLEQISRVTLGGMAGDDEPKGVLVVHLTEAVEPAECLKAARQSSSASWEEETIGKHKIHIKGGDDLALHWADPCTLVVAKPRMFLVVLAGKKPARLSTSMEAARASLDLSQTMTLAVAIQDLLQDNPYRQYVPISDEVLEGIGALTLGADFDDDLTIKATAVCSDESIAWQLKGLFGGAWQLMLNQMTEGNLGDASPSALEVARSVRLEVQEKTFSISARIPAAVYAELTDSEIGEQTLPSPYYVRHDKPSSEDDSDGGAPELEASSSCPQPWDPYAAARPMSVTPAEPARGALAGCAIGETSDSRVAAPTIPPPSCPPGGCIPPNCPPASDYGRLPDASGSQYLPGSSRRPTSYPAPLAYGSSVNTSNTYTANSTTPYANTYPAYPRQPTPPLDGILGEVARMASAGLDEEVILAHIRCHVDGGGTVPKPDADDLIGLHKSKVDAGVLLGLMQLALEQEQTSEERAETETGRLMFSAVMPSYTEDSLLRADTVQVGFVGPRGAQITREPKTPGTFKSEPLICPQRTDFTSGIHRLKVSNLPNRPGFELHPTLEIGPTMPQTEKFLAHNTVPVQFTEEDLDHVMSGDFVTKVIYLPDPEFQQLSQSGVETLVSSRLDPGQDPIVEADRRGSILAIVRLGSKLELPGYTISPPHEPHASGTPIGLPGPPRVPLPPPETARPQYGLPVDGRPIGLPTEPFMPLPPPPPKMVPLPAPTPDAEPIRSARRLPHWLRPVSTRRSDSMQFDRAEMKRLIDEWERIWFLDQPDHVAPRRTHGGIL